MKLKHLLFFLLCCGSLRAADNCPAPDGQALLNDLMIVEYWNQKINDRLPVTYNNFLQGGYINMPSARMGQEGEIGAGYSHVHPYLNYNLRFQLIDRLEISGNYRIFKGVDDPILTPLGFGDMSDKGVNVKFAFFHPEDSDYKLPGFAFGFDDFIGTKNFKSQYLVFTQVFLDHDAEVSVGYGFQRLRRWFGGIQWTPFRRDKCWLLRGISLVAEYDATPYHDPRIEKHPRGRRSLTGWNGGFKYRIFDYDFSISYVRGHKWAFAASTFYNFGNTKGFLPKINDPLPYHSPVNVEPLGEVRPEQAMVQDLVYAFRSQGFDLLQVWMHYDEECNKVLRLNVYNIIFRSERDVRSRLNNLLAYLIPSDIDLVVVTMESEGFPIQDYRFWMDFVRQYGGKDMCAHELRVLSPMTEASFPDPCTESLLFKQRRDWWNIDFYPQTHTFFGSSRGKFKYALGLSSLIDGFVYDDVYYSVELGYTLWSNLHHLQGVDRLNPSKLINVRTDIVNYYRQPGLTVNEAYFQKVWNMGGTGWYTKAAGGYLEREYAGLAGEFLYYPVEGRWAIGLEGAIYRKRSYRGLGFTDKVRKTKNYIVHHKPFPYGSQYFLDLYYEYREAKLDTRVKIGKFLANDYGARYEISRNFDSGMRITFWYTYTNGNDVINGKTYHDKGVEITMPLDLFYLQTSRETWSYGMSAWLRDVGVIGGTGKDLYYMINDQR